MLPPPEVRELTIKDYVDIVLKRIWIVVTLVAVITGFIAFYSFSAPKIYKAITTLHIEKELPRISPDVEDIYAREIRDKEYYQTQYSLLQSRSLSQRVAKALNLASDPEFIETANPAKKLLKMIRIEPVRSSNIVLISVLGLDPLKITNIANTWAQEFIHQDIERRMGDAQYGVTWLESQLSDTGRKLQEAEEELNRFIRKNRIVTIPDIDQKEQGLINNLKSQRAQLEEDIAEVSERYGEKHPTMISLMAKLSSIEEKLQEETDKFLSLQEKMVEYKLLKRKVDTYKSLYEDLLKRAKELDLSKELAISNIRVVDKAEVPTRPVKPQPKKDISIAIVGSLFLSVGLCFFLEYLDSTLKNADDVEFYVKLPFLGYIPSAKKDIKLENIDLIAHLKPHSRVSEALRNVRVSLIFSFPEDKPFRTIVTTSAIPKEGKTFCSSNISIVFAQTKEPTLLIDADMRKGRLSRSFGVKSKNGLSSLLAGICSLEEAVVATDVPHLSLLPCGPHTPNPTELLNSEKLQDVLAALKNKYSKIIIDAPPVLSVADALIIGDKCDGFIFVIRAGYTALKYITEAKKIMEKKVKVVGTALNSVDFSKDRYYYYHYYYAPSEKKT